jgi:hypothetical protein
VTGLPPALALATGREGADRRSEEGNARGGESRFEAGSSSVAELQFPAAQE